MNGQIATQNYPFVKSIIPLFFPLPKKEITEALPGTLFRTRRPDSLAMNFSALKEKKITHVVNLLASEEENEILNLDTKNIEFLKLDSVYRRENLEVISFPIPDLGVPEKEKVEHLIDVILDLLTRGNNVSIHCRSGCGRTGLIVACVAGRVFGLLGSCAILWTRKQIPGAIDTLKQEQFIRDFLKERAEPEQAILNVETIENNTLWRVATLVDLAKISQEQEKFCESNQLLLQATAVAVTEDNPGLRADAFFKIFEAQKCSSPEDAKLTLQQIMLCFLDVNDVFKKAKSLLRLVKCHTDQAESQRILDLVIELILTNDDINDKIELLIAVAKVRRKLDPGFTNQFLNMAQSLISQLKDPLNLVMSLCSLASVYRKVDRKQTLELALKVREIACLIENPKKWTTLVKALSNLAGNIITELDLGEAEKLLGCAELIYECIEDPANRDEAYYYFHKAQKKWMEALSK
jgi:protein-tyrosine phosphatase